MLAFHLRYNSSFTLYVIRIEITNSLMLVRKRVFEHKLDKHYVNPTLMLAIEKQLTIFINCCVLQREKFSLASQTMFISYHKQSDSTLTQ